MSLIVKNINRLFSLLLPTEGTTNSFDVLQSILEHNKETRYGKKYQFDQIQTYEEFAKALPIIEYDDIKEEITMMLEKQPNILIPKTTTLFGKSSGTTSDYSKYLPVTNDHLMKNHIQGMKEILGSYIMLYPESRLFTGETITINGGFDPNENGLKIGYISALIKDQSPLLSKLFHALPEEISFISDRRVKVEKIYDTCKNKNIVALAGVTSRQVYLLEYILQRAGKKHIREIWPNFELVITGGMNYRLYNAQFKRIFGHADIHIVDSYNATEGFFGYDVDGQGLNLTSYDTTFYEFQEVETNKVYTRDALKAGERYRLIVTNNSGLYRYLVGDVLEYQANGRFKFSGRIKEYLDGFSEHIIVDHTDSVLSAIQEDIPISHYSVGTYYLSDGSGGHHRVVETETEITSDQVAETIDTKLRTKNQYYDAKRKNDLLIKPPRITIVPRGTFTKWLENNNKLGGQHKVPKLRNDMKIVDGLLKQV